MRVMDSARRSFPHWSNHKQWPAGLTMVVMLLTSPVMATPALTTANVNFREGPSTSYPSMGTVPDGTEVDVAECDETGSWCAVSLNGQPGFISGRYLDLQDEETGLDWPRVFNLQGDASMVLYQPQFSSWDGLNKLEALVAAEYRTSNDASAVFGVIGLEAKADRNEEACLAPCFSATDLSFL